MKLQKPCRKRFTLGFVCPICGGYKFGTSNPTENLDEWVRYCRGDDDFGGCGFTWKAIYDSKYGLNC